MNKKIIEIIIVIVVIGVVGIAFFLLLNNSSNSNNISEPINNGVKEDNSRYDESRKVLVVYFSATSNTRRVAEKIADNLNGDVFEIVPEEEYTSEDLNWTNSNSRVSKEHDDETLRDVKLKTTDVDNWDSYDIVIIGYPIWWGVAAWPVNTFVKANDFSGKTIIPFCTSASSGLGQSAKLLKDEANGGSWQEGLRFSSSVSDTDIKKFTDSIK